MSTEADRLAGGDSRPPCTEETDFECIAESTEEVEALHEQERQHINGLLRRKATLEKRLVMSKARRKAISGPRDAVAQLEAEVWRAEKRLAALNVEMETSGA